jgi:Flp pilus assembly protein TadB
MMILVGVGKVILAVSITAFILSILTLIASTLLAKKRAKDQGNTAATLLSKRQHESRLVIGKRSWSKGRRLFEHERFVSPEVLRSGNATTADWIMAVAVTLALVSFASIFLGIGFLFAPVGLVFSIVGILWVVPILRAMWTDWKKTKKKWGDSSGL